MVTRHGLFREAVYRAQTFGFGRRFMCRVTGLHPQYLE